MLDQTTPDEYEPRLLKFKIVKVCLRLLTTMMSADATCHVQRLAEASLPAERSIKLRQLAAEDAFSKPVVSRVAVDDQAM